MYSIAVNARITRSSSRSSAIRQPTTEFIVRNRLTPAEPLQHHAHMLTCRHAGEFQIVAGENVPRVLDLQLLATSEESLFGKRIGRLISFLRSSSPRCQPPMRACHRTLLTRHGSEAAPSHSADDFI